MIQRFWQQLTRLTRQPSSYRYLLAVSGGADSNVMAFLFHESGLDCTIAHCNFHLRGTDSDDDMQLVQKTAKALEMPLLVREFDTIEIARSSKMSVEMAARKLRYDWFAEAGRDFDFIVTAHHANDAAETTLLNLVRGTGLKGMVSIPETNGKIIRPMLAFTANEIRDFARSHNIPFAIDCTNSDETIQRNRVRHSVLPQLQQLNPNLIETMRHNQLVFKKQYDFYRRQMDSILQQITEPTPNGTKLDVRKLEQLPDCELILTEFLLPLGFAVPIANELLTHPQTGTKYYSQTHTLLVNREHFIIEKTMKSVEKEIVINNLNELRQLFLVERMPAAEKPQFSKDNHTFYIAEDKLRFPVTIRTWRNGDFFYPLGGGGRQKLSDFFNNRKIDGFTKRHIALFCVGHDIAWIVGYRSDDRYKLITQANDYFKITENDKLF